MNLDQMMTEAHQRRMQALADMAAERERREQEEIAHYQQRIRDLFGELVQMLDIVAESNTSAAFTFNNQPYRLYEHRHDWMLLRLDARADDDERPRPSREFFAKFHSLRDNRDNFLLALAELDDAPDVPPLSPCMTSEPETAPRVMNDYEERLLDALRLFLQSVL